MTIRHLAAVTGSALLVFGLVTVAVLLALRARPSGNTSLAGAVLMQDSDPKKQMPLADVQIIASSGKSSGAAKSDASGFFNGVLQPAIAAGREVTLTFEHHDYKPLTLSVTARDQLYVARLVPIDAASRPETGPENSISDVRIRYTVKQGSTVDEATVVRTFQVVNQGNLPCRDTPPCSPDGKWKAAIGSITVDAPENAAFRDVRVSCIAGPCPFAKVESNDRLNENRRLRVTARNWSDTATFLVEADVVRTVINDMVRRSFPVIFGRGMSFTLPGTAAGPSIEAELNGSPIVFPLGPALLLSWATCTLTTDQDQSRLYSCELKPGYRFQ